MLAQVGLNHGALNYQVYYRPNEAGPLGVKWRRIDRKFSVSVVLR